ncbi:MAG: NAD(P)/FAD-dependent oxidoreductase [Mycobacteriales bacterium]
MECEAIIVGGGPAGLSAALQLARWNRSVLVLDSGEGRSTHHQVNHNYLGFVDGIAALELRELGRKQLSRYPHVSVLRQEVTSAVPVDGGFAVRAGEEPHTGRVLVLACGVVDEYPDFEDAGTYIGRSMFRCITCDGYECRGKRVVVVGDDDHAAGEALQLVSLTPHVTLLAESGKQRLSAQAAERLAAAGVRLVEDGCLEAHGEDGILTAVRTAAHGALPADALFVVRAARPRSELAVQLGAEVDPAGYVVVDTDQHTTVPSLLAAGDLTSPHSHQVSAAVHEGAQAASAANYLLYPEGFRLS